MKNKQERELKKASLNRQEIIKARLTRRELFKLGLLTSAGYLVAKAGLSSRASAEPGAGGGIVSPPTTPFVEPLPISPILESVSALNPAPTVAPNTAAGEGRTRPHQAFSQSPPKEFYVIEQKEAQVFMSPDLPEQTIWGFNGMSPGPTYVGHYGVPILVRNFNDLPLDNGGFGLPSVTTHLHNGHTPSESDGFPCDFFERGQFYDQHYPNVLAGGDIKEAMSTLFYHDHRIDFTAQNVYKGLAGFYLLFNEFDNGDETKTTGFRLPSFPAFDIPMMFADKVFDPDTGLLFFDLFNLDGILGDKFLVNGKIQPFFEVHPRRYRFRWLNIGPSRFYEFFLTDLGDPGKVIPFWQISNDGNLLPKPVQVTSTRISVSERRDVIIDFRPFAGKTLYLENRLEQKDGRGPTGKFLPAGQGNRVLEFTVSTSSVTDNSVDPATMPKFYDLPSTTATPRVTRTFRFDRQNGQWAINNQLIDQGCTKIRFRVKRNSVEKWFLQNNSGGWAHPIHIHFEEFQILKRNGKAPSQVEKSRKDTVLLGPNEQIELFFRFRDFVGRFPMHCHNVIHEDHAMMLRFDIDDQGDLNTKP